MDSKPAPLLSLGGDNGDISELRENEAVETGGMDSKRHW